MDSVTLETRSRVMAQVRSKRNRSTEWRLRACLIRSGIRGWTLDAANLIGKPDFIFPTQRVVVFVDGCFWHGCPKCQRIPSSNVSYWEGKIARNRTRDRAVNAMLRKEGWKVLRVWEHQLGQMAMVLARIKTILSAGTVGQ